MLLYTEKFNLDDKATSHEISFLEALKQLLPQQAETKINLQLPTTEHPQVEAVTDFIQQHLDDKISMAAVVNQFGLSERTMLRLFQNKLQLSFSQYVKLVRMVNAVEMLMLPRKNVSDVAYAVGYESVPTFSNNFNEIMGIRPNQFLQK